MRDDCELPIKNSVSSQDDGQEILVFFFSNAFLNVSSRQFKRRAHSLSINSSQCMSKRTSMMRDSAAAPPADIKTMSAVVEPLVMIQLSYFLLLIKKNNRVWRKRNQQTNQPVVIQDNSPHHKPRKFKRATFGLFSCLERATTGGSCLFLQLGRDG